MTAGVFALSIFLGGLATASSQAVADQVPVCAGVVASSQWARVCAGIDPVCVTADGSLGSSACPADPRVTPPCSIAGPTLVDIVLSTLYDCAVPTVNWTYGLAGSLAHFVACDVIGGPACVI